MLLSDFTLEERREQTALWKHWQKVPSLKQPGVLHKDYKERFYLFINSQMEQERQGGTVRAEAEVNSQRR